MKKRNIVAVAGVLAVAAIGGTMAYFNQELSVENKFDTPNYDSTLIEDFQPSKGENWEPGVEIEKEAKVENTGDVNLVVRVKLDEIWTRQDKEGNTKEVKKLSTANPKGKDEYEDLVTLVEQVNATDGLVADDKSVVAKTVDFKNWIYNDKDGYYYYKSVLTPGASTNPFLQKVQLIKDADMGNFVETKYYSLDSAAVTKDTVWTPVDNPDTKEVETLSDVMDSLKEGEDIYHIKSTTDIAVDDYGNELLGYGNADYTLTITAQTVQATDNAVKELYKIEDTFIKKLGWELKEEAVKTE